MFDELLVSMLGVAGRQSSQHQFTRRHNSILFSESLAESRVGKIMMQQVLLLQ